MTHQLINMIGAIVGLIAGGLIGAAFGMIQDAARRRHEKLQQDGKLHSAWTVMPGSGRRVAFLLMALVLIQIICPLLFRDGTQWWVSAGLLLGYGATLFRRLRERKTRGF